MLNLAELLVLGFASARGTQLIVHDSILDAWRARFEMWHARKFESKPRTFLRTLLGCVYCVGFHTSWVALLSYLLASGTWSEASWLVHGVEAFAVAGVAMIINRFDDSLGD